MAVLCWSPHHTPGQCCSSPPSCLTRSLCPPKLKEAGNCAWKAKIQECLEKHQPDHSPASLREAGAKHNMCQSLNRMPTESVSWTQGPEPLCSPTQWWNRQRDRKTQEAQQAVVCGNPHILRHRILDKALALLPGKPFPARVGSCGPWAAWQGLLPRPPWSPLKCELG